MHVQISKTFQNKSVASSLVEMSGILNLKGLTSFSVTRINKEIKVLDTGWLSLFENNKNITTISRREFDTSKRRLLLYVIWFVTFILCPT